MRNKIKKKEIPLWKVISWGAMISMIITLIMCALFAKLIVSGIVSEDGVVYMGLITLMAASYVGGKIGQSSSERKLVVVMSIGAAYVLLLLALTSMLFRGGYSNIGPSIVAIFGGCALALIPIGKRRERTRISKRLRNG